MTEARTCPSCGTPLAADAPQGLCPACLLQRGLADNSGASTGVYHPGFTAPTPAELAVHFPQLEILELLGQGGMGAVYKARQAKLDRLVALKILPPSAGRDPHFAERFLREARALAKLDHPHIVGVHDFGETGNGLHYFLMEYVDGVNLRQVLRSGRLPPEQALGLVPQVCEALHYAHEEGVVHRDIKPENILMDKKGRVKIADFGLAKLLDRDGAELRLTATHQAMGTPHYMAPEQIEKPLAVDHRADIYSLGVVFYEMLTGELPLGRFAPPSQKVQVDVRLDEVVLRALEREPDRRYQSISDVKTALDTLHRSPVGSDTSHATTALEMRADEGTGPALRWRTPVLLFLGSWVLLQAVVGVIALQGYEFVWRVGGVLAPRWMPVLGIPLLWAGIITGLFVMGRAASAAIRQWTGPADLSAERRIAAPEENVGCLPLLGYLAGAIRRFLPLSRCAMLLCLTGIGLWFMLLLVLVNSRSSVLPETQAITEKELKLVWVAGGSYGLLFLLLLATGTLSPRNWWRPLAVFAAATAALVSTTELASSASPHRLLMLMPVHSAQIANSIALLLVGALQVRQIIANRQQDRRE